MEAPKAGPRSLGFTLKAAATEEFPLLQLRVKVRQEGQRTANLRQHGSECFPCRG